MINLFKNLGECVLRKAGYYDINDDTEKRKIFLNFQSIVPMPRKKDDLKEYRIFHKGIIKQILKHGGSLSHHHGVGRMFAPWMEEHLGKIQMDVLRCLKKHFDPNNIMNPGGTLGLDT